MDVRGARALSDRLGTTPRVLTVTFDVTGLTADEVHGLAFEASVQAETSERHPGVPEPRVLIEPAFPGEASDFTFLPDGQTIDVRG